MAKEVWLKLLTKLLWSKKYRGLPSNDHRAIYTGTMILEKLGLSAEPVDFLATTLMTPMDRYMKCRQDLIACGLFNEDGTVAGFEDSQTTPAALRQKRWRDSQAGVTSDATRNVTNNRDSREQKAESRSKNPRPKKVKEYSLLVETTAKDIVEIVNLKHGLSRSANDTVKRAVHLLIFSGHTREEIIKVVSHRVSAEEWFDPKKFGVESLIRLQAFPAALERASESPTRPTDDTFIRY